MKLSVKFIILIIVVSILIIGLFVIGLGQFLSYIQEKFGTEYIFVLLILLFAILYSYDKKELLKNKKELKEKKSKYLKFGKLIFKNQVTEFEEFFYQYINSKDIKTKPIKIIQSFAEINKLSFIVDWRGEENEGEIQNFIISKIDENILWTNTNIFKEKYIDKEDGVYIIDFLKNIDKDLKVINKKMLFLNLNSDSYIFLVTDISTFKEINKIEKIDFYGSEKLKIL